MMLKRVTCGAVYCANNKNGICCAKGHLVPIGTDGSCMLYTADIERIEASNEVERRLTAIREQEEKEFEENKPRIGF